MRHRDLYNELTDEVDEDGADDFAREMLKGWERRQNELIWAHYRARDVTQREAAEAVIDDRTKVPGQSHVSRIYRRVDREILYNSAILGDYQDEDLEDHESNNPVTGESPAGVADLPEAYAEALKDLLAELILRRQAIKALTDIETEPAAWMVGYLPDAIAEDLVALRTDRSLEDPYTEAVDLAEDVKKELDRRNESPAGADA